MNWKTIIIEHRRTTALGLVAIAGAGFSAFHNPQLMLSLDFWLAVVGGIGLIAFATDPSKSK